MTERINPVWRPGTKTVILPALTRDLVELLGPPAGLAVLDLACGSGTCAIALALEGAEVAAIDVSDAQLASLSEEASRAGVAGRITGTRADAAALPFPDGAFDLVTGVGALSNIEEPVQALREALRVLKPHGRLALGDFLVPIQIKDWWSILSTFRYGYPRPYLDYGQVQDLLFDAGLRTLSYRPSRWRYPAIRSLELNNAPNELSTRYEQALRDAPSDVRAALHIHEEPDCHITIAFDCFALVAERFAPGGARERTDRLG